MPKYEINTKVHSLVFSGYGKIKVETFKKSSKNVEAPKVKTMQ